MIKKIDPVPVEEKLSKEQVRAMFPNAIAFADECRVVFGDDVKLVYAEENGRCIGKRPVCDPEGWISLSDMEIDSKPVDQVENRYKGKRDGKR